MGGEQRGERAVDRRHQLDRFHIGELRQTEPIIFPRDLDAERAELAQPVDDVVGNLALAVDAIGIDVLAEESLELVEKRFRAGDFVRVLFGVGVNQVHPQLAEEQVADEAGRRPFLLACRFGDLTRLVGADLSFGRGESSHVP